MKHKQPFQGQTDFSSRINQDFVFPRGGNYPKISQISQKSQNPLQKSQNLLNILTYFQNFSIKISAKGCRFI